MLYYYSIHFFHKLVKIKRVRKVVPMNHFDFLQKKDVGQYSIHILEYLRSRTPIKQWDHRSRCLLAASLVPISGVKDNGQWTEEIYEAKRLMRHLLNCENFIQIPSEIIEIQSNIPPVLKEEYRMIAKKMRAELLEVSPASSLSSLV